MKDINKTGLLVYVHIKIIKKEGTSHVYKKTGNFSNNKIFIFYLRDWITSFSPVFIIFIFNIFPLLKFHSLLKRI